MTTVSEELHKFVRLYRRDRWWFAPSVRSSRIGKIADTGGSRVAFPEWKLFLGKTGGLAVTIRANCYDQTGPGKISFQFGEQPNPRGNQPLRRAQSKSLTIRIGLVEEGKRRGTIGKIAEALAAGGAVTPDQARRMIRTHSARAPGNADQEWWIDPKKTPVYYTQFVFFGLPRPHGVHRSE